MLYRLKGILTILYFFGLNTLSAQLNITLPINIFNENDFYNIVIQNQSNTLNSISIELKASVNGRPIYQAETRPITLNKGVNQLNYDLLQPIQVLLNELDQIENEERLLIDVKLIQSGKIISRERKSVMYTPKINESDQNQKGAGITEHFGVEGAINILGQISDRVGVGSQVPQNFLRSDGRATFNFSDLPVDFAYLLTSENSSVKQSMNRATVRLNVPKLKQNLKERIDQKIKESETEDGPTEAELALFKEELLHKKFPEYPEWDAYFNSLKGKETYDDLTQWEQATNICQSKSTGDKFKQFKKLAEKEALSTEEETKRKGLHQFVLSIISFEKKQARIQNELGDDFDDLLEDYKQYNEAEAYYNDLGVDDYKRSKSSFNPYKYLSKTQKILNSLQAVSIGTFNPYFSDLTLSGLLVNGVGIEIKPGQFYFSGVFGRSAKEVYNTGFSIPDLTLSQNTYGLKMGYGRVGETYLHASFVNITDSNSDLTEGLAVRPRSNRLVGFDGGVSLLDNQLTLEAEWVGSMLDLDKNSESLDEANEQSIPLSFLFPSLTATSSFDQAYRLEANYRLASTGTQLDGSIEKINPNFASLGTPTLIANTQRWQFGVRQGFLNNQIQLGFRAQQIDNSLNPLLSEIDNMTESYGADVSLNFSGWPSIFASYAPFAQNSQIIQTGEEQFSDTKVTNLSVSYPYSLSTDIKASTQVSYFNQELESNIENTNSVNTTYSINQSINYKSFGLNAAYSLSPNQQFAEVIQDLQTLNLNGSIQTGKLGVNFGFQMLDVENKENKIGYQLSSTYQLTDYLDFEIRGLKNIYESLNNPSVDFDESILQTRLSLRFGGDKKQSVESATPIATQEEVITDTESEPESETLDEAIATEEDEETIDENIAIEEDEETKLVKTEEVERDNELVEENKTEEVIKEEIAETNEEVLESQKESEDDSVQDTEEKTKLEEITEEPTQTKVDEVIPDISEELEEKPETELVSTYQAHHYKILFTTSKNPNKAFLSVSTIGPISAEEIQEGLYGYYIGPYDDLDVAQSKLKRVQSSGFENAMVLEFDKGAATDIVEEEIIQEAEDVPDQIEEIFSSDKVSYHILFRVLDNPNERFDDLKDLGPLYRETFDDQGNSRYLVGNTDSYTEARQLLEVVKLRGYKAALVAEYLNGKLKDTIE